MKKRMRIVLTLFLAIMVLLPACTMQPTVESPPGVISSGDAVYYVIKIPAGKDVEDYFRLKGDLDQTAVAVENTRGIMVVTHCGVVGGGRVMWKTGHNGIILYFPETYPHSQIKNAMGLYAIGHYDRAMTIETAREYIPVLRP